MNLSPFIFSVGKKTIYQIEEKKNTFTENVITLGSEMLLIHFEEVDQVTSAERHRRSL